MWTLKACPLQQAAPLRTEQTALRVQFPGCTRHTFCHLCKLCLLAARHQWHTRATSASCSKGGWNAAVNVFVMPCGSCGLCSGFNAAETGQSLWAACLLLLEMGCTYSQFLSASHPTLALCTNDFHPINHVVNSVHFQDQTRQLVVRSLT